MKHQNAKVYSPTQILLPEISHQTFTYPGDEEALAALKSVPGAGPILTWLQENFTEQITYLTNNEQMIRANADSYPSLHALVVRCCQILSCPVPELYITTNPVLNAYTSGQRRTCIVLHSALVETLTPDELCFVIGHEIGHIKCAHGLYRQLGDLLIRYWDILASVVPIPGLGLLRVPLLIAYWEWYRRAEFTCDRAALLCVQDLDPSLRALAKLAGSVAGYEDELHMESAIQQVEARKDVNKLVLLVSILENAANTHPFIPVRLKTLREYAASEDYQRVLSGDYKRDVLGLHEGGERVRCNCGTLVNSKLSFCPQCGSSVSAGGSATAAACVQCQTPLPPGTRFCPKCGAKQAAAEAPQSSQLDQWKNTASSFFKK
ncbi:MAG TPA: M48 family metallopeptidase [Bryobacteraceae bacterium]|nr:M48 family metallopeptidase [Bryobacteraceae bacterium]